MRRDSVKMIAFCAAPSSVGFVERTVERFEQGLAFSVMRDGRGETREAVQIGDLRSMALRSSSDSGSAGVLVGPFLSRFIQGFVVLVEFFFQRFARLLLLQLGLAAGSR